MKTITLKDIPPDVHAALKERAGRNGRSLNKEVLACLEKSVSATPVNPNDMLCEIRAHRSTMPGKLTDRLVRMADEEHA